MEYLYGLIGLLIGGLFFYRTKAKSAEALNENVETKSKVESLQGSIESNNSRIQVERETIEAEQSKVSDSKKERLNNEELADFLNKFKSGK